MNRETNMPNGNDRLDSEASSSASHSPSGGPDGLPSSPEFKVLAPRTDPTDDRQQFIEELKRGIESTRLPAHLMEQILAELPPPEEQERLYREMQEKGGIPSEQFLESLGLEVHSQP